MGFCFIRRYDLHHMSLEQRLTKSTTLALPATTPRVRAAKMEANGNLHPLPRKLIFCGCLQSRGPVSVIPPTSAAFLASRRVANDNFGFGGFGIEKEDSLNPIFVVEIGLKPREIQILTGIDGVSFEECRQFAVQSEYLGRTLKFIGLDALLRNKKASGRPKDLIDVEELTGLQGQQGDSSV